MLGNILVIQALVETDRDSWFNPRHESTSRAIYWPSLYASQTQKPFYFLHLIDLNAWYCVGRHGANCRFVGDEWF
jgi:hypothetical protein